MSHFLNPFDFVPFFDEQGPDLRTSGEWQAKALGPHFSGRIRLRLKTLTPLFTGGEQEATTATYPWEKPGSQPPSGTESGALISQRCFYRAKDASGQVRPSLPGSAMKALLRAYVEALTNGLVSAAVPGVPAGEKRHKGYALPPEDADWNRREGYDYPGRIPEGFLPGLDPDRLDLASYLFGLPGTIARDEDADSSRWAARIRFDDAFFQEADLGTDARALDVIGKTSFGQPNPRVGTWWYFVPGGPPVERGHPGGHTTAFLPPGPLRGRKFYFHQDPVRAVDHYLTHWDHMNAANGHLGKGQPRIKAHPVEAVRPERASDAFHVHFDQVPSALLMFLLTALRPSCNVRHKAGGLRPFGFGSVEFQVEAIELRPFGLARLDDTAAFLGRDQDETAGKLEKWADEKDPANPQAAPDWRERWLFSNLKLVSKDTWPWIRFVSAWPGRDGLADAKQLFVYPPFCQQNTAGAEMRGFAVPLSGDVVTWFRGNYDTFIHQVMQSPDRRTQKIPVEFDHYQRAASNFALQARRSGLAADWHHRHPKSL